MLFDGRSDFREPFVHFRKGDTSQPFRHTLDEDAILFCLHDTKTPFPQALNIFGHINKFCTSEIHPVNITGENMITFYIVRHGQTLLNQLDRAQGWADSPLTASGKQAAKELGKDILSPFHFVAFMSGTEFVLYMASMIKHFPFLSIRYCFMV